MRMSALLGLSTLITTATIVTCTAQAQLRGYTITSAPLKVDTTTSVPGTNLKPGTYTIRVIDNLKDRYILGVDNSRSKEVATFIGMQQHELLPGQGKTGPILWANAPGKTSALRGFSFGNGMSFEFVYPKATAVELAKINANGVLAIDPESEGMPVDPALSIEDRKIVTLWMLSSTRIGPGKGIPAIEAQKYQAKTGTEVAQNDPPAPPVMWSPTPAPTLAPAKAPAPGKAPTSKSASTERVKPIKVKAPATAASLPQTASDLPLLLTVSCGLLLIGFAVGVGRRFRVV